MRLGTHYLTDLENLKSAAAALDNIVEQYIDSKNPTVGNFKAKVSRGLFVRRLMSILIMALENADAIDYREFRAFLGVVQDYILDSIDADPAPGHPGHVWMRIRSQDDLIREAAGLPKKPPSDEPDPMPDLVKKVQQLRKQERGY